MVTEKLAPITSFGILKRLYFANPTVGEWYYLRLLLTIVLGPISYEDLRIVDSHLYNTF